MFKNRSVIELMVLMFSITVSAALICTGGLVAILELKDPANNTDDLVRALTSMTAGMLGALLGLLAGKSESMGLGSRPDGKPDSVETQGEPPGRHENQEL